MGAHSKIQWTDATWNPTRGCTRVSEGCRHCYAEVQAVRFIKPGMPYEGLAVESPSGPRWTGELRMVEALLEEPLKWRNARKIFVNSMSDLFHEKVPDEFLDRVFATIAASPRHVYQVLTKREDRMLEYMTHALRQHRIAAAVTELKANTRSAIPLAFDFAGADWPLPNVWLGISAEDQKTYNQRAPALMATPSAVHFLSLEPLLGPIDLLMNYGDRLPDWVIVGGESGKEPRRMQDTWASFLMRQCKELGILFFMKQMDGRRHIPDALMVRQFPAYKPPGKAPALQGSLL